MFEPMECQICGKSTYRVNNDICADCECLGRHEWLECPRCGDVFHMSKIQKYDSCSCGGM